MLWENFPKPVIVLLDLGGWFTAAVLYIPATIISSPFEKKICLNTGFPLCFMPQTRSFF